MLLTIGMIVKDEEKYLGSCLEALKPILEKVDSELIIVDTGSTDSTVDIAKRFTGKVFHFEWCDDFAAARNAAMKRAKGKWYMSIDADEIIEDAREIIDFFNTGEYKKYNAASYVIRSSNKADASDGTDYNALRLIKVKDDSYYIYKIHERFGKIYTPIKHLKVIAKHYGYVTEKNEEHIKYKMQRNLKIMHRELERNPSDCEMYYNISNAYKLLKEDEKALEYCIKGLDIAKKQNDSKIHIIYARLINLYFRSKDYIKAIELANEYFKSKSKKLGTDLDIYFYMAEANFQLKKYKEAINLFEQYIDFLDEFKRGIHNTIDTLQHPIRFSGDYDYNIGILRLAKSYYEIEEFTEALKYLDMTNTIDRSKHNELASYRLELEIKIMLKTENYPRISRIYKSLDKKTKRDMQIQIEQMIANSKYQNMIIKEFAAAETYEDKYCMLMGLRKNFYEGNLTVSDIEKFFDELDEVSYEYADAIYFALHMKIPLNKIRIDTYDVERYFYRNVYFHFKDLADIAYNRYEESSDGFDIGTKLWVSSVFYNEMISDRLMEEEIEDYFIAYSELSYSAIKTVCRDEILKEENIHLLPHFYRAGYYCHNASEAYERDDLTGYIKYLRKALKNDERLKDTVKKLSEKVQEKLNEKNKKQAEFEAYAGQAKQAIKKLISEGKIAEAMQFTKAYEELCPDDPDLTEIKSKISAVEKEILI